MAKEFPLYDQLLVQVNANPNQAIELQKLCQTIRDLPAEHAEIVYALIYHHEMLETQGVRFRTTPYNGKIFEGGKGITFTYNNLPVLIRLIVAQYVMLISAQHGEPAAK